MRTTHDSGELLQGGIGEAIALEKRIEAAELSLVGQLGARNVIGNGTSRPCDGEHLVGRYEVKLGRRVDESGDQPRASDPVNLRAFPGDPLHGRILRRMEFQGLPQLL